MATRNIKASINSRLTQVKALSELISHQTQLFEQFNVFTEKDTETLEEVINNLRSIYNKLTH